MSVPKVGWGRLDNIPGCNTTHVAKSPLHHIAFQVSVPMSTNGLDSPGVSAPQCPQNLKQEGSVEEKKQLLLDEENTQSGTVVTGAGSPV